MARVPVEVVIQRIHEESFGVVVVDMAIDGLPHHFHFQRQPATWRPGGRPGSPFRQGPKFTVAFKAKGINGRPEVMRILETWERGEPLLFPVRFMTTRRA